MKRTHGIVQIVVDNAANFSVLLVIAAIVFAVLDWLQSRPPRGSGQGAHIMPIGPNSPGQVVGEVHYHQDRASHQTLDMIVKRYESIVLQKDQEIDSLKEERRRALSRAEESASLGDRDAQEAIEEARTSGKLDKLQAVLIHSADQYEQRIAQAQTHLQQKQSDYIELSREIAAIAYLRGDIDEAEKRLTIILKAFPEDLDEAERMHGKALEIFKKLGQLEGIANDYGNLGGIYLTRGDLDEAERMHRKALEIEEKLGRLEGMANQYANLGLISQNRGNQAEAVALWQKSRDLFEEIGMPHMVQRVQG